MAPRSIDRKRARTDREIAGSSDRAQRPAPAVRPRTPEYGVLSEDDSELERTAVASERGQRVRQRAAQLTPPPTKPTQHKQLAQPPGLNAPAPIPPPVFRPQSTGNNDSRAANDAVASDTGLGRGFRAWHGGRSTPNNGRDDEYTVAPDPQSPTPLRYANRSSMRMPRLPPVGLAQAPVFTDDRTHVHADTVETRIQAPNFQKPLPVASALQASGRPKTPPPAPTASQAPKNGQLDSDIDGGNSSQSAGSRNSVSQNSILEALSIHKGAILYIFDEHVKEPSPRTRQMLLECVNSLRLRILAVEKGRNATREELRKSNEVVQQLKAEIKELKAVSELNDQKITQLTGQVTDLQNPSRTQRRARGARARSARERNNNSGVAAANATQADG